MKKQITSKSITQALLIGVCSLIVWSWYQGGGTDQPIKLPTKTEQSVGSNNELPTTTSPVKVPQHKVRHVIIQAAGAVKVPKVTADAPDAVKNFRNWAESYFAAEPADRSRLISKGKELADLHRVAMKQTIPLNPQLALELAVPMVVRQDLPDDIEQRLESRINDRGKMMVLGAVPEGEAQASEKAGSVRHLFEPESAGAGNFYNAYLYGSRATMRSRNSTRVSGVAVDGELAVLGSPVRVLEIGERPDPEKPTVEVCPVSGKMTPIEKSANGQPAPVTAKVAVVEDNRKTYILCASGHIGLFGDQLTQGEADSHWGKKTLAEGGTGGGALPFNLPPGWTTGTKKLLYLRVAFPDILRDPQTESSCYENLRKATEYYMTNSYGQFYLTPTVAPLIVLPYPQSWYNSSTSVFGNLANGELVLRDHALTIAARMGYDPSSYDLDVVQYEGGPGSFGGMGYVGSRGVWLKTSSVAVLTHELGHNLGLFHANFWVTDKPTLTGPGLNQEYGNKFDVMGSTGGIIMGPLVSVHKSILSWLSPAAVHQVTANGIYRIYQGDQDRADADKRYAMSVKMDSERDYWFEFRQTHLTNPSFMNGLMVNWSAWGSGDRIKQAFGSNAGAQLLDMTPGSRPGISPAGSDSRDDAGLVIGHTYSDTAVDLHITPIFKSDTGKDQIAIPYMDVVVNRGPFPGNQKPSLTLEATTRAIKQSQTITFTATGVDAQGDRLAYAWDFGDKSSSIDNSRIQKKQWADPGRYQVLCVVSDMKGLRTIKSLLVEVQDDPTEIVFEPLVSGTIRDNNNLPVEGVYVSNQPLNNSHPATSTSQAAPAEFRSTYTDGDGNYTLTNLEPGFPVSISAANYPNIYFAQGVPSYTPTLGTDKLGLNWQQSASIVPNVNVVVNQPTVTEGGTSGTITLTRSSSTGTLAVQVMLRSQGSATRDSDLVPDLVSDYTLSWRVPPSLIELPIRQVLNLNNRDELRGCQGVSFADGQTTIVMTLTSTEDAAKEGTEYIIVDFPDTSYSYETSAATRTTPYHVSGQRSAVIAILDNDTVLPQVKLSVDHPSIGENGDSGTVRLIRDGSLVNPLIVELDYTGIAVNGADFSAPIMVVIPAGQREATVNISTINDRFAEGTESLSVSLRTSASYVNHNQLNQATFLLLDDDQPIVQVTAPVYRCSEASPAPAKFVIIRSAVDIREDLLVKYSLGGSALSGSDYRRIEGTAVIPANELSVDIQIVPIADSIDETDQTVVLRLSTEPEYTVGVSNEAVVSITDNNQDQFTIVASSDPVTEPAIGTGLSSLFRIERPVAGTAVKVKYRISTKSTASVDLDYVSPYEVQPFGEIEFLETDLAKNIQVEISADTIAEPTEQIVVELLSSDTYSLGFDSEAIVLILDGDSPGITVSYAERTGSLANISENPARRIRFQFWRPGTGLAISSAMRIFYSFTGNAQLGTDFALSAGQTVGEVNIQAQQNSGFLELDTIDDAIPRGTRKLEIYINQNDAYGIRTVKSSVYMDDNETYPGTNPVVGFSTSNSTVIEKTAGKATEQDVTVSMSAPPTSGEVTVEYRLIGGSATGRGVDYSLKIPASDLLTPTTGFLRFTPTGPTSQTFKVVTNPDTTPEGDETIVFQLVNASGANIGISTHTLTLQDDAVPEVFTDPITGPAHTSATLRGKFIASNRPTTSYFEWGSSPTSLPNRTINEPVTTGTSFVTMTQVLSSLKYPATYYYRAVATNAVGTSRGIVRMIRTQAPPTVVTTLDAGHTANSITFAGTINPNRGSLRYYFRYGNSPASLSPAPLEVDWFSLPNGTTPVVAKQTVSGLVEGQNLYYQLEAVSDSGLGGTVVGGIQVASATPTTLSIAIQLQPVSQTVTETDPVTFVVTATGTGALSYQWQKDGVDILGATQRSFSLANAKPWNIGDYTVKVTDSVGTVTSEGATLRLNGVNSGIWKSLVTYYTFDDDLSTEISGVGQNLNVFQVTRGQDRFGVAGAAASFEAGQSSRLTTTDFFPISGKGPKSISAWIRYNGPIPQDYSEGTIVRWGGTATSGSVFELRVARNDRISGTTLALDGGGNTTLGAEEIPVSRWNHVVLVNPQDSGINDPQLWVNGVMMPLRFWYDPNWIYDTQGSQELTIGGSPDNQRFFEGSIDEVRIYNRALSATEVQALYSSEATISPILSTPSSSQISDATATLGGNVTTDGGATITERGVIYSATTTNADPLIGGVGVTKLTATGSTGVFTVLLSGLTHGTSYSFKAYATNSQGTSYTSVGAFTTLSTNADLSALTLSNGTLSPAFAIVTTAYTAGVSGATTSITVTPTAAQANATIEARVNGGSYAAVTNASGALALNVGTNTVDIRVTAQDGVTQKTYTVTITREKASAPITLAQLTQVANGTPRPVTVSTTPAELTVKTLYAGSATAPSLPGSYAVTSTIESPLYQGTVSGTLTVLGLNGLEQPILSGSTTPAINNGTDYGNVTLGRVLTRVFTLLNPGSQPVALSGNPLVEMEGDHVSDFQVSVLPETVIPAGGSVAFEVRFAPTQPGLRTARVKLASAAIANGPLTFAVQGFGSLPAPRAQTIAFAPPTTVYLSQPSLQLTATSSSGLPVSLQVISGPAALGQNGVLNLASAGTVKVEARQAGNGSFAPAPTLLRTITVKADPTTLTLVDLIKTYNGEEHQVGIVGANASEVVVTYRVGATYNEELPVNAGQYPVKAVAGSVTKTGTLIINPAPLYVNVEDKRRLVGEDNPALTVLFEGFIGTDSLSLQSKPLNLATTATKTSSVGSYAITSSGGAFTTNYKLVHRPGTLVVEGVAGSYEALLKQPGSGLPNGHLALTVPAASRTFTASLRLGQESAAIAYSGNLTLSAQSRLATATLSKTAAGVAYELKVVLSMFGELNVQVRRAGLLVAEADDGIRLLTLPTGQKSAQEGSYTAILEPALPAGQAVPVGAGWATVKVDATGKMTLTGKLADGTGFTTGVAADVAEKPGYRFFVQPYATLRKDSYVGGSFTLVPHPRIAGKSYVAGSTLTWVKAGQLKDLGYRSGFGPVTSTLRIDPWQAPTTTQRLAARLELGVDGRWQVEHSSTGSQSHVALPTLVGVNATNVVSVVAPPANARKWKMTLTPTTGAYTGSFELLDLTEVRTVNFSGVLRQTPTLTDDLIGAGHYLLPALKTAPSNEQTSGALLFWRPE